MIISKVKIAAVSAAAVLFILPIIMTVIITTVNDNAAAAVAEELRQLPLPADTVFIESVAKAGKLTGNGNGMQYYGAILVSSSKSVEELQQYYKQYNCNVNIQVSANIDMEHGDLSFITTPFPDHTFIVERWGNSPSQFFAELDIRGH